MENKNSQKKLLLEGITTDGFQARYLENVVGNTIID